jgi:hypothetical protein
MAGMEMKAPVFDVAGFVQHAVRSAKRSTWS